MTKKIGNSDKIDYVDYEFDKRGLMMTTIRDFEYFKPDNTKNTRKETNQKIFCVQEREAK